MNFLLWVQYGVLIVDLIVIRSLATAIESDESDEIVGKGLSIAKPVKE
ncbi:MAG: hypothetical protein Kow00121_08260 [Elainellaceae cyanobacterium]